MVQRPENYEDFLRSPEWRAVREQVMRAEHGTCHYCDVAATEVHHYAYEDLLHPGYLVAVCRGCHEELEEDRLDDPVGHLSSAPVVQRWIRRKLGARWFQSYTPTQAGQAWLDARRDLERDSTTWTAECRLCGKAINPRFELCYRCAKDEGAI